MLVSISESASWETQAGTVGTRTILRKQMMRWGFRAGLQATWLAPLPVVRAPQKVTVQLFTGYEL